MSDRLPGTPTRAGRVRRTIVSVEVIVLVVALMWQFAAPQPAPHPTESAPALPIPAFIISSDMQTRPTASKPAPAQQPPAARSIVVVVTQTQQRVFIEMLGASHILKRVQLATCDAGNLAVMLDGAVPHDPAAPVEWLRDHDFVMAFETTAYTTAHDSTEFSIQFANGSRLRLKQHCPPATRSLAVYVDHDYSVHVMDAGVISQQAQFAHCHKRDLHIVMDAAVPVDPSPSLGWLGQRVFAAAFDVTDYYIISTNTEFAVHFDNGSVLRLQLDCALGTQAMMVYALDGYVYVADYQNNDPTLLLPWRADCALIWDTDGDGEGHEATHAQMARPATNGWLPDAARVAFRFDAVGGIRVAHEARGQVQLQHGSGAIDLRLDCA